MNMKLVLALTLLSTLSINSLAQSKAEQEIRDLEQLEFITLQRGDTIGLLKIWSKDLVVNNPFRQIVTMPQIFQRIREGKIDYSTSKRLVEKVTFIDNVAVSMGTEVITPQNQTTNAGKTVTRQYTNIWLRTKEGWRMIARQASIVTIQ